MAQSRPGLDPQLAQTAFSDAGSEHILLEGDGEPTVSGPLTEQRRVALGDRLRGAETILVFYAEGYLNVRESRRGKRTRSHRLNLRYVDPVPKIERHVPKRVGIGALACAAAAALAALVGQIDAVSAFALPLSAALGATAVVALAVFVGAIHERTVFVTQHGRAPVLTVTAGLGAIRRYRAVLPALSRAIEDAGEDIGEDTKNYLRSEMREHYRLHGDGVLSDSICSDSTGRILAQFDVDF